MTRNWRSCTKWLTINWGVLDQTDDKKLEVMYQMVDNNWGALDQTDDKKLEVMYQMVDYK
jgi:hypothetical protein